MKARHFLLTTFFAVSAAAAGGLFALSASAQEQWRQMAEIEEQGSGNKVCVTDAKNRLFCGATSPIDISGTQVAVSATTMDSSLTFEVGGNLGAVQYCDETGNNCFTAATAGGLWTDNTDYISRDGFRVYVSGTTIDFAINENAAFWDEEKGAFRAGATNSATWDEANIGANSIAVGDRSEASSATAVAMGQQAKAQNISAIALGYAVTASGLQSVALGRQTTASGDYSLAAGYFSQATASRSVALGNSSVASGGSSFAAGQATAQGPRSVAIGTGAFTGGNDAVALGAFNQANAHNSFAAGYYAQANGTGSFVFGQGVQADGGYSTLFGLADSSVVSGTSVANNTFGITGGKFVVSGTSPLTANGNLLADFNGQIGATEYCDENGNNCFTSVSVTTLAASASPFMVSGTTIIGVSGTTTYATDDFVFGSPQLADDGNTDHDARMFFDKSKAAFRAGWAGSNEWDDVNVGVRSIALGQAAKASGDYSIAFGRYAVASGNNSFASGYSVNSSADNAVTLGYSSLASAAGAVSIGWNTESSAFYALSTGYDTVASGQASTAMGRGIQAQGDYSFGIGLASTVTSATTVPANTMAIVGGQVGIGTAAPDLNSLVEIKSASNTLYLNTTNAHGSLIAGVNSADVKTFALGHNWDAGRLQLYDDTGSERVILGTNEEGTPIAKFTTDYTTSDSLTKLGYNLILENTNNSNGRESGIGFATYPGAGNGVIPGAAITGERVNSGSAFDSTHLHFKTKNDGGNLNKRLTILSTGNVGISTSTPDASLTLDVAGNIGAENYCDETGNNCFTAASVGGANSIDGLSDAMHNAASTTIIIGHEGGTITSGTGNTALGHNALDATTSGYGNTALGDSALTGNTTGYDNVAVGIQALLNNSNGIYNIAVGRQALQDNTAGDRNIAVGHQAIRYGTATSNDNIAVGYRALYNSGAGQYNLALGSSAGLVSTGDSNIFLGYQAGASQTAGSNNIIIGAAVDAVDLTGSNQLNIGNVIQGDVSSGLVYVEGTYTGVSALPANVQATGTRMFFDPATASFRAGYVNSTGWTDANMGLYSFAFGSNSKASGGYSISMGDTNSVTGIRSVALGSTNNVTGNWSTALGSANTASNNYTTAIGRGTKASGVNSTAMGYGIEALGDYSFAIGIGTSASGTTVPANTMAIIGGQVGISTTTPDASLTLDVAGNIGAENYCDETGNNCFTAATAGSGLWSASATDVYYNSGNVGIGTDSPSQPLEVSGTALFSGSTSNSYTSVNNGLVTIGVPNAWSTGFIFQNGGGTLFKLTSEKSATLYWGNSSDTNLYREAANTLRTDDTFVAPKIAVSGTTLDGNLLVDVEGQIGAMEYCDENGNNCFTSVSVTTLAASTSPFMVSGTTVIGVSGTTTYATDDFVFGSPQLDDDGNTDHDKRMFFDKSKAAFRAGAETSNQWDTSVIGNYSIAMGTNVLANVANTVAIGSNNVASGQYTVAIGQGVNATSFAAVGIGYNSDAVGAYSTAFGRNTLANGESSFASGVSTQALGLYSTAMGKNIIAGGDNSFGIGLDSTSRTITAANTMAIMGGQVGISTTTPDASLTLDVAGNIGAENYCDETGNNCFTAASAGGLWTDNTDYINRDNIRVYVSGTTVDTAYGDAGIYFYPNEAALRVGKSDGASWDTGNVGTNSFSNGNDVTASGDHSAAFGRETVASGISSFAIGRQTTASNIRTFASGQGTTASGWYSASFGWGTTASGVAAIASGQQTTASGNNSIAMGVSVTAQADNTFAIGLSGEAATITTPNTMAIVGGQVAISGSTADGTLALDVEGQIGATEYCDENGNNCFTSVSVTTLAASASPFMVSGTTVIGVSGTTTYATDDFVFGSPQLDDDGNTEHDKRMFFDKSKGAFRAGAVNGTEWNSGNVGTRSVAFGLGNIASFDNTFVTGAGSTASGTNSVAMGGALVSSANNTFAQGGYSNATGDYAVVIGHFLEANALNSYALGKGFDASNRFTNATANSFSIGYMSATTDTAPDFIVKDAEVGVGVTDPSSTLHVAGEIQLSSTGVACGADNVGAIRYDATTKRMYICSVDNP